MGRPIVGPWSYTGDPESSSRDRVRYLIGDVDVNDRLVSNKEVDSAIANTANNYAAGAELCGIIAAYYAREVASSVNVAGVGQSVFQQLQLRYKQYLTLKEELTIRASGTANPYAGGISSADKLIDETDSDMVGGSFSRGQFDNNG